MMIQNRRRSIRGSRLTLLTAPIILAASLLTTGCGSPPSDGKPAPPPAAARRSILLVTLDTTRADRLGCYGSDAGLTPFLDGFAEKSFLFECCRTPVPLTLPAHTSLLSGYHPMRHGVRVNVDLSVPEEVPLLQQELSRKGYQTSAFIGGSVLLSQYGLNRGFDLYDDTFYDTIRRGYQKAHAEETLAKAERWLRKADEPFFCWIHLFDPHVPYAPPAPFDEEYPDRPYDGEVAYMDHHLGLFFERLGQVMNLDDLLVIFVGDHGESLGEHGEQDHGIFLYESCTHVPFLLHMPGQKDSKRVPGLVSLLDIAPTIREMTGLKAVACDGESLFPLLGGEDLGKRYVFLESVNGMWTYGWAPLYGVTDGHWKYILAPRPELYDVTKDPAEVKNLVSESPEVAEDLKAKLIEIQGAIEPLEAAAPAAPKTPEDLKRLASLGYLGGTFEPTGSSAKDPKDYIHLQVPIVQASLLLSEEKYEKAHAALAALSKEDPSNPYLIFMLGQSLSPSDPEGAIAQWKKALKIDSRYYMAWTEWVVLLLNRGEIARAAATARVGLRSCEDRNGVLHTALAEEAFLKRDPPEEVHRLIDEALARNPFLARAKLLRSVAYVHQGRMQEAQAEMASVWECTTMPEVKRWAGDPVFQTVFESMPEEQ